MKTLLKCFTCMILMMVMHVNSSAVKIYRGNSRYSGNIMYTWEKHLLNEKYSFISKNIQK